MHRRMERHIDLRKRCQLGRRIVRTASVSVPPVPDYPSTVITPDNVKATALQLTEEEEEERMANKRVKIYQIH